jgi:hypothetical protein
MNPQQTFREISDKYLPPLTNREALHRDMSNREIHIGDYIISSDSVGYGSCGNVKLGIHKITRELV